MENTLDLMEIKEAVYTQEDFVQLAKLKDRPIEFSLKTVKPGEPAIFRKALPVRYLRDRRFATHEGNRTNGVLISASCSSPRSPHSLLRR